MKFRDLILEFVWREDDRRPRLVTASGLMFGREYARLVQERHPCLLRGSVGLQGRKNEDRRTV